MNKAKLYKIVSIISNVFMSSFDQTLESSPPKFRCAQVHLLFHKHFCPIYVIKSYSAKSPSFDIKVDIGKVSDPGFILDGEPLHLHHFSIVWFVAKMRVVAHCYNGCRSFSDYCSPSQWLLPFSWLFHRTVRSSQHIHKIKEKDASKMTP